MMMRLIGQIKFIFFLLRLFLVYIKYI